MDRIHIFNELQKADWETISKELLAFAIWWAERYRWRSGSPEILPKGNELADVVQHVILQTINFERNWDPDKGELIPWLKDQVKSVLDALAKSATQRKEAYFSLDDENSLSEKEEQLALQVDPTDNIDRLSPEEIIINEETEQERSDYAFYRYAALFYATEGDRELEEVLEAVINGCELKPRFLAEELNVPVDDIYNRLKRLRRKAMIIKEKE